jgi:hypothetical protein
MAEQRNRLSAGSFDLHTGQSQPITGIPCDVPLPRIVNFITLICLSNSQSCKDTLFLPLCVSKTTKNSCFLCLIGAMAEKEKILVF